MRYKFDSFNNKLSENSTQRVLLAFAISITFILIYVLNYLYPLHMDDWAYSFKYSTNPLQRVSFERINSIQDIFISQYNHYYTWGGRSVVHCIAQFLLYLPAKWHDILNSLAYTGLVYLMYSFSALKNKSNVFCFLLIAFLFWFLQPVFASTMLWITGSANYLWGTLIIVAFAYPFYSLFVIETSSNSIAKSIAMFMCGIIAGWTNENTALGLIFIVIFFLILSKKQQINIPSWAYFGLIGAIIGYIIMISAPGNYIRLEMQGYSHESLFDTHILKTRIGLMLKFYRRYLLILVIPCVLLIYYLIKRGNTYQKRKILPSMIILVISSHIAFAAMIGAPIFPERALFGSIVFLIIALGIAYGNIPVKNNFYKKINLILLCSILTLFCIDYISKAKKINLICNTIKERENIIYEGKKNDIQDFVFTNNINVSKKYYFEDLHEDPTNWINEYFSMYYEIHSAKLIQNNK